MSSKLLVLGGGLSGLSAAYYARQQLPHASVTLVEANSRLGGWVHTTRTRDGVILEHGPHTIRPVGYNGANTLNLIEDLGLAEKVRSIHRDHPAARVRMVYCKEALHTLPSSFGALFSTQPPFSRPLIASLLLDLKAPRRVCKDESVHSFFARRIGEDVADFAVAPLLRGVCAGDARNISVQFLFRVLFEAEQNHGSIFKGLLLNSVKDIFKPKNSKIKFGKLAKTSQRERWSVYTLENGLQTLPETLASSLLSHDVTVLTNDKCEKIEFHPDGVEINLKSGKKIKGKHIISSVPAKQLAGLVVGQHPHMAKMLAQQESVTVGVVNLRYKGNVLTRPAFGFLVPPSEKVPLLGVIYDSTCFPNFVGDTVLTAMIGGHSFYPQFAQAKSQDLASIAAKCIKEILHIKPDPCENSVTVLHDCIPQYTVGHYERNDNIFRYIKDNRLPIKLIGASYNGISVNDVIMSAQQAVSKISNNIVI